MRLSDIMSTDVTTATPEESARLAWTRMQSRGIHHLVVKDGDAVVGVVTERDLGGRHGPADGERVGTLMSHPVVAGTPEMTVKRAANVLRGRNIGCLPVIDDRELVGIVTISDLLDLLGREVFRPTARAKRFTLTHKQPRAERTR